MSKHIFEESVGDRRYHIELGWDRPLQQFYGSVFQWVEDRFYPQGGYWDEDNAVLASIFEPGTYTLNMIVEQIQSMGITIPDNLLRNVMMDRYGNVANNIVDYDSRGVASSMSR